MYCFGREATVFPRYHKEFVTGSSSECSHCIGHGRHQYRDHRIFISGLESYQNHAQYTHGFIAKGMVGLARGQKATAQDMEFACQMFASSGEVLTVDESQMNAITAISGSGPAYFFRFCEIMVQAAKEVGGFSNEEAELLVRQTPKGRWLILRLKKVFLLHDFAVK